MQCIAAFSAQFPTLGCIDLCSLDLTEFSKNTWQMKNQCSAWPLLLLGLSQTPTPELGFKGTISPPGLPHSRHSSFPLGWGEPNGSAWMLHVLQLNTWGRRLQKQGLSLEMLLHRALLLNLGNFPWNIKMRRRSPVQHNFVNVVVHRHLTTVT